MEKLRNQMWVRVGQRTGIVTSLEPLTVDIVDEKGETVETVQPASARQAKWKEIPAARRPTAAHGKKFGYV